MRLITCLTVVVLLIAAIPQSAIAQVTCGDQSYFVTVGENVHIPAFLFGDECGAINLEQPFELSVSDELKSYSRSGRLGTDTKAIPSDYDVLPIPNLGVDWQPVNLAFEAFGDTVDEMVISQTTSSNLIIGLGHTYYDPLNYRRLGLDWLRLIPTGLRMQGDTVEDLLGKTITITQEIGQWRTTVVLELTSLSMISTADFNTAGSFVNPLNGAIAFDPSMMGLEIPEVPTLMLAGCIDARIGGEVDWWGNRLMVGFALQSVTVESIE